MKKMVSLMLAALMILSSVSCFAAVTDATVHGVQNNVFVEGNVGEYIQGETLLVTITDGDDVVYVNEFDTVNADGSYTVKFKHKGDLSNALINVKYAGEDVTSKVFNTVATSQIIEADVFVTDKNDRSYDLDVDQKMTTMVWGKIEEGFEEHTYTSNYVPEKRTGLKAVVNIKNKYAYEEKVSVMVAAYDVNNKLLDCKVEEIVTEYAEDGKIQAFETAVMNVPENTVKAKAFCWSSTSNLIPFGEQANGELPKVTVHCIGDSFCQTYEDRYYPLQGWGAFIGDYFNKDFVTVNNHGKSGAWVQSALSSEQDPVYQTEGKGSMPGWDMWNKMEAAAKEGDYVVVALGINDETKPGPDGMSAADWHGLGIEEMILRAKANKLNIVICSAPLRAEFDASSGRQAIIDKTEEIAKKYEVPYLNINDPMEEQYRKELGYDITKNYTKEEKQALTDALYDRYYLRREGLMSTGEYGFGLSQEELDLRSISAMHTGGSGYNSHPNVRGADNIARLIAELLKDSESDLRFYVK